MANLPLHKANQSGECGVSIRTIDAGLVKEPIEYSFQDSRYTMLLIKKGSCRMNIDFKEYCCSENEMLLIGFRQAYRFVETGEVEGMMIRIDSAFVDSTCRMVFGEYALNMAPFSVGEQQRAELEQIVGLLSPRMEQCSGAVSKLVVRAMVSVIISIVVEIIKGGLDSSGFTRRDIEVTVKFRNLLDKQISSNRSPSSYASQLHLSLLHLNEVLKSVTGMNVSKYIQNELILCAKRMLVYSSRSIQEISNDLGVDDYAYFSHLFSKATGVFPLAYRKKCLK